VHRRWLVLRCCANFSARRLSFRSVYHPVVFKFTFGASLTGVPSSHRCQDVQCDLARFGVVDDFDMSDLFADFKQRAAVRSLVFLVFGARTRNGWQKMTAMAAGEISYA